MDLGATIKILRKRKGSSQKDFSEAIGISQTSLSQIENGQTTPHKKTLDKICKELNVSEKVLMLLSLTEDDVPKGREEIYKMLYPNVRNMITQIFYEDEEFEVK